MKAHERTFVALDTPDEQRALDLVRRLSGEVGGFKIGLELFVSHGPALVREVRKTGAEVFLDLKLHDIPNTVAGAAAAAARLGASFLTVHALGGTAMIRRAKQAVAEAVPDPPRILAVTVLTSHDDEDLDNLGVAGPCGAAVERLARLARESGADGLVCSPLEVQAVREALPDAVLVVPGIRPASSSRDDQARVATPARAVAWGADRLVIGRPITRAEDPAAAARSIAAEIGAG